jgi:hypothetical protein
MASKKRKKRRQRRVKSHSPGVQIQPNSDHQTHSEYENSDETLENRNLNHLPDEVRDTIDDLYEKAQRAPHQAIPELERRVATYPEVPMFSNHLSVAYMHAGESAKAETLVLESYRRYPQYLFAKINYAYLCLRKGEITKIPSIFDHKMELPLLYPHRKRFDVSEVRSFAGLMCRYYQTIGERDTAVHHYGILKQVAPRDPLTKRAKRILYPPFWGRILKRRVEKRLAGHSDNSERCDLT